MWLVSRSQTDPLPNVSDQVKGRYGYARLGVARYQVAFVEKGWEIFILLDLWLPQSSSPTLEQSESQNSKLYK